jgi:hypothetical protein
VRIDFLLGGIAGYRDAWNNNGRDNAQDRDHGQQLHQGESGPLAIGDLLHACSLRAANSFPAAKRPFFSVRPVIFRQILYESVGYVENTRWL